MLLWGRIVDSLWHDLLIHIDILLRTVVHEVALLSGHGIVVGIDTRLSTHNWSDDGLHVVLDLLLVHAHILWGDRRRSKLLLHLVSHAQVHALELLSSCLDVHELLLQTLLLLCKVHVGGHELGVEIGIHLLLTVLINKDLWRGKNLLWYRVHLAVVISLALTVAVLSAKVGSLWSTI